MTESGARRSDDERLAAVAKSKFMCSPFHVTRTSEREAEWEALEPDIRAIYEDSARRQLALAEPKAKPVSRTRALLDWLFRRGTRG